MKTCRFELTMREIDEFLDAIEFVTDMITVYQKWGVDAEFYDTVEILNGVKKRLEEME